MARPNLLMLGLAAALTTGCSSSLMTSPSPLPGVSATTSPSDSGPAPGTARYRVTFQASWSNATHPVDFPSSAHFSSLVGGTHSADVAFWREGGLATDGIRDMAERGSTSRLSAEMGGAVSAGTAEHVFTGGNISVSPGSATAEFDISQRFPLVTLVSMVAPSPDWFVGVSGQSLFQNGQWTSALRVSLDPWDAGTDGGATFDSPDLTIVPRLPITRIITAPLSPSGRVTPLGTFTFSRIR
jgi:hypothetical protein